MNPNRKRALQVLAKIELEKQYDYLERKAEFKERILNLLEDGKVAFILKGMNSNLVGFIATDHIVFRSLTELAGLIMRTRESMKGPCSITFGKPSEHPEGLIEREFLPGLLSLIQSIKNI